MTGLHYTLMAPRDIEGVQAIDDVAYPNPWSASTWRKELASSDRLHMVALDGARVVGHAGLLFVLDEVHVTTVATASDREGEGVATALLVRLLDAARDHGAGSATLEVRAADARPQRLYARFGFRPAGVRRDYYRDPTDDGIVMWLHDLGGEASAERLAALRVPGVHRRAPVPEETT